MKFHESSLVKRNVYQNTDVKHSVAPICNEPVTELTFLAKDVFVVHLLAALVSLKMLSGAHVSKLDFCSLRLDRLFKSIKVNILYSRTCRTV